MKYDFSGWATRNDIRCSDGRTILKDAFKGNDGQTVPLVWNHKHGEPFDVLGHVRLENREEGVYAYGTFNDTEQGRNAKLLVEHGDINALSIYANDLKHTSNRGVKHGNIREVSLVLAGANPGAFIDSMLKHSEDGSVEESEDEGIIYTGEEISLYHAESEEESSDDTEETLGDIFNTMSEKQKTVVYAMLGASLDDDDDSEDDDNEGGSDTMKHNIFDRETEQQGGVLCHAEQAEILDMAKSPNIGTLQTALSIYAQEHDDVLQHGIDDLESLFPEYKDLKPGAPELINRDQGWVSVVLNKTHKSPISRIRTRQADARGEELRAYGYKKGNKKDLIGNVKLLKRTTDPQTVYVKDKLERDDIIDITEFDVVSYVYGLMRQNLNEELATAILIGDGREEGDEHKIDESHIRSIWHDDDLYCIHHDVDIAKAKAELQGTNTGANFGDNYIYAEAIITAALYSREKYKGSGSPDFYCTPHLLNVMLLARDLNGRRIYDSKTDLAAALNVNAIHTVEQFEGKTRLDKDNNKKKLLGIFVNLADYQVGSTKGGEITKFEDFDIDFNQYKYLLETRLSGALIRVYSAICLEEPATD